nr:hypothetical protein BaRGS_031112 [Batillaria attramentaria]
MEAFSGGFYELQDDHMGARDEGAARLYAIILEVHDKAGNVNYARRLVLYDNTSTVELKPSASLHVVSANPQPHYLPREFGQVTVILVYVPGPDNSKAAERIAQSYTEALNRSAAEEIPDVYAEAACVKERLKDGETYDIWEDSVRVSIDHTGPSVSIEGLRGRFGRDGLYVHNTTDLSSMLLLVHAADPHSGIKTLEWTLGTRDLSVDVGRGAIGTACNGNSHCYCPAVGECESHQYLFSFANLVHNNSQEGQHHREYYITITATNHASLRSRQMMDILIDESPPTVGVVLEGLSDDDQAEMDFTSSDVVHARWHGFLDHESGILLYRVVLADRCLTGHYFVSVVAYNGAMKPSGVACSDGITYDTTPPRLLNVSITHARTGSEVACTQPDQPWLVNTNMTRVRLARTSDCLNLCTSLPTASDVEHLPVSSNHTIEEEASGHFCRTLPKMTEDSYIVLPSDYLKMKWAAVDAESEMEEYHVGMGRDRTTASAPDLLPFTPTHGHHSYHARHSGLGHGAVFFIFLRALSKAGLHVQLTLGPVLIDETPPVAIGTLPAAIDGDFLMVTWTNETFTDPEQPSDVDFEVSFRVGHDAGFVSPFLAMPEAVMQQCKQNDVTGCARYPISVLQTHDTEQGRLFFFQLHGCQEDDVIGTEEIKPGSAILATLNTTVPLHIGDVVFVQFTPFIPATDFEDFLRSKALGSKLHELYDMDIDFARSDVKLSAILTDGANKNVTWFLMTNRRAPADGSYPGGEDIARSVNVSLRTTWTFENVNITAGVSCIATVRGEGVFDTQNEAVWRDVGRNMTAVLCLPGSRVLKSGMRYVLHVRTWISREEHVTFISDPVVVDHTPPQVKRGGAVMESDVDCGLDRDYVTTEPYLTACWDGVFRESQSQLAGFEVSIGTSPYGMEQGIRYYVTVRAVNDAGLMTTAVSDGVTVDVTPPVAGVVFNTHGHTNRHAQSSTTTMHASWHGFDDRHSEHGVPLYATVHAENHAGQWSRFISQPVTMDRTTPDVREVKVSLNYGGDAVSADVEWTAADEQSGVVTCTCELDKRASLTIPRRGELKLDWDGVFKVNRDVTFSMYAGTAEGYGDIFNHVVTKETSFTGQHTGSLSSAYVTIEAVNCSNPAPKGGGAYCTGSSNETQSCILEVCPSTESSSDNTAAIAAGASVGALAAIAAGTACCCLIYPAARRKIFGDDEEEEEELPQNEEGDAATARDVTMDGTASPSGSAPTGTGMSSNRIAPA